jgi:hypothetical protein
VPLGPGVSQLDKRGLSFREDGNIAAGHYEALALQRPMLAPYESIHEAHYMFGAARLTLGLTGQSQEV